MMELTTEQLAALQHGRQRGWLPQAHGMQRLQLVERRWLYDEARHRDIPTGDFKLTTWGLDVARGYAKKVERKPVGTLINHRIHAYKGGTVVLADDSGSKCSVDTKKPMLVSPGVWMIPLVEGGHTIGTSEEGWYLRNLLKMSVKLDKGVSAADFRVF